MNRKTRPRMHFFVNLWSRFPLDTRNNNSESLWSVPQRCYHSIGRNIGPQVQFDFSTGTPIQTRTSLPSAACVRSERGQRTSEWLSQKQERNFSQNQVPRTNIFRQKIHNSRSATMTGNVSWTTRDAQTRTQKRPISKLIAFSVGSKITVKKMICETHETFCDPLNENDVEWASSDM